MPERAQEELPLGPLRPTTLQLFPALLLPGGLEVLDPLRGAPPCRPAVAPADSPLDRTLPTLPWFFGSGQTWSFADSLA